MFKQSVAESVLNRASVHTRHAAFEAVSARDSREQNCSAPLLHERGTFHIGQVFETVPVKSEHLIRAEIATELRTSK